MAERKWSMENKNGKFQKLLLPLVTGEQEFFVYPIPQAVLEDKDQYRGFRNALHSRIRYYTRAIKQVIDVKLDKVGNNMIISLDMISNISEEKALYALNSSTIRSAAHHDKKIQAKKFERIERSVKKELTLALISLAKRK